LLVTDTGRDGTGSYELTLQRTNNPANVADLNYGVITDGSLEAVTGINVYRFTANANDKITICSAVKSTTGGYFSPYLELYDNAGSRLAYSSGNLKYTFTTTGTFYLFITDSSRDDTGAYRFILSSGDVACSSIDFIEPEVSIIQPKAGEIIETGSTYTISWSSSDNIGITSQEIRLSTDGGVTFPTTIASGLGPTIQSFDWLLPTDLTTTKARIKIIVRDTAGNQTEDQNRGNFIIAATALPAAAVETIYEYDALNQLSKSNSPDVFTFNYTYDALGNRLTFDSSAPLLTPIGAKTANEGQLLQFVVSATDPNGRSLVYSTSNLPAGATFNPADQTFNWKPSFMQAGNYVVHFEVTNNSLTVSEDVPITVNNVLVYGTIYEKPDTTPIPSEGTTVSVVNILRTQTLASTTTDSQGKFFLTSNSIPDGNYIIETSKTGYKLYSGITILRNTQALPFSVTLYPPVFGSIPQGASIDEGQSYSLAVSASDANNDKLSFWSLNLPQGATFIDNQNNTADFNWTPQSNQSGTHVVNFKVTDGLFTSGANLNIEVKCLNKSPVLNPIPNVSVYEGNPLNFRLIASDPNVGDILTFFCVNLPTGASLNSSTGNFSWKPNFNQKGQYNVTFKVSDDKGAEDSQPANITVINSSLYGSVLESFTKKPISNAQIKVYLKSREVASAVSDASGNYILAKNLSTGIYIIRMQVPGYVPKVTLTRLIYDNALKLNFYTTKLRRR